MSPTIKNRHEKKKEKEIRESKESNWADVGEREHDQTRRRQQHTGQLSIDRFHVVPKNDCYFSLSMRQRVLGISDERASDERALELPRQHRLRPTTATIDFDERNRLRVNEREDMRERTNKQITNNEQTTNNKRKDIVRQRRQSLRAATHPKATDCCAFLSVSTI